MRHLSWLLLVATVPAGAQRLPDPIDNRWEVQLHDVRAVLEATGDVPSRRERIEDLAAFARTFVEPRLDEPSHLQFLGADLLVLRGHPRQQASLAGILRALSESGAEPVTVECQLLSVPRPEFRELAESCGLGHVAQGGGGTVARIVLDAEKAAALHAAIRDSEGVVVEQNPRVMLLPGQHATLTIGDTIYYRQDVKVEAKGKVWPITGELHDGLAMELRAGRVDEDRLGLWVQATHSDVQRPIPTFAAGPLPGQKEKFVVDLPTTTVRRFEGALRLRDGDLGVIVSGTAGDSHRQLLLVRADEG